jgi:hypothetical protein
MEVRGYYHPYKSFATIAEWEAVAKEFLSLQKQGFDTRGGMIDNSPELIQLVNKWFGFQLYVETQRFEQLTQKMVLDFIEDFINHRVWGLADEFAEYIVDIKDDKFSFFYSRGAIEPYILLDGRFTTDTYGSTKEEVISLHWTSEEGLKNLQDSIDNKSQFSISTFTTQAKSFFRPESNILVKVKGNLVAAFQSDVKSLVVDNGDRAANLFRFSYPDNENNLCRDWEKCKENKTALWNEIIMKPIEILDYKKVEKY